MHTNPMERWKRIKNRRKTTPKVIKTKVNRQDDHKRGGFSNFWCCFSSWSVDAILRYVLLALTTKKVLAKNRSANILFWLTSEARRPLSTLVKITPYPISCTTNIYIIQGVPASFRREFLAKISNLREIRILDFLSKKFVKL